MPHEGWHQACCDCDHRDQKGDQLHMIRPLPPFTVRPLKHALTRKTTIGAAAITALAGQLPSSVKATRRPLKSAASRPLPSLRVIAREL